MTYTGSVAVQQSYTFRDIKNQTARMNVWYDAGSGVETDLVLIAEDLVALSDTQYVFLQDGTTKTVKSKGLYTSLEQPYHVEGSTGEYYTVADKAVFYFLDIANKVHKYQVACPKQAIFLSTDLETIDFTNSAVKQFVADVTFTTFGGTAPVTSQGLCTSQGTPLLSSIGGLRHRGKMPRKFNIFTRAPSGGQGE